MIEKLFPYFCNKPHSGLITSICSALLGWIPNIEQCTRDFYTFIFQIIAFTISAIAGIITICATVQRMRYRKKQMQIDSKNNSLEDLQQI